MHEAEPPQDGGGAFYLTENQTVIDTLSRRSGAAFSEELRRQLPPVRVTGVCARAVDTELWHRLPEPRNRRHSSASAPASRFDRVGKPEDIADA
jgi:NAD(P)-dependent dehydrogenase (short-subunit alcohol dehydrogenase family)